MTRSCRWACLLLIAASCAFAYDSSTSQKRESTARLPITTSSAEAREFFQRAMRRYEDYDLAQTLADLRQSVAADPKFAQALILVAHVSHDPVEQAEARNRALKLMSKVTPGEQLLIRWMASAQENDCLPAIAAMNDLLAMFPQDQHLAFMAGGWLNSQQRYDQAVYVLERAVTLHPDYPAALNNLAYAYAYTGAFDKAFAAMERYITLEPDQANPHDSYGELLRMNGKFEEALDQYRMSVRIDPTFGSEVGIADTYAVMGKEQEARDEYQRAIVFAGSRSDKIALQLQSAITWLREGDFKEAERNLTEVEKAAHSAGLSRWEAEAHRVSALYERDSKQAMKHLQAAEHALQEHQIATNDRDDEEGRILRVEAARSAESGDMKTAVESLNQLEALAVKSNSRIIQQNYEAATGAVLVAQGNFSEAIPHLEEDADDAISMELLWKCYTRAGDSDQATTLASKLSGVNSPTVEQAFVVPRFRTNLSEAANAQH